MFAALLPVPMAAAAAPTMTPAAAGRVVVASSPTVPGSYGRVSAAVCRGLGKAANGRYETFRCTATWRPDPGLVAATSGITPPNKTIVVWARAASATQACTTAAVLAVCAPGKLTPLPDVMFAAEYGTLAKLGRPAVIDCTRTTELVATCTYRNGTEAGMSTVTFARNAAGGWSITIALSVTCTGDGSLTNSCLTPQG